MSALVEEEDPMDAAADLPIGQQGEETFHLIEPGRAGRRVMDVPVRALQQPVANGWCFVGGIVVHDEMNVDIRWDIRFHLIKEATELGGPVPGETFADDPPGGDIQGRNSEVVPCRW